MVGSFLAGNQHEQKPKKQKPEVITSATPTAAVPMSTTDPVPLLTSSSSFRGDSWPAIPTDTRNNKPTDINVSLSGG